MTILQIEHKVPDYDGWKKVFDSDPIGRKRSGVKRYTIYRPTENKNYVIIHLEFDNLKEAQATLAALQILWGKIEGSIMVDPQTRILDMVEAIEY